MQERFGELGAFAVALVGDDGVGKRSLWMRHLTGMFEADLMPSHELVFHTTRGRVRFRLVLPALGCVEASDCALLMFEVGCAKSYARVPEWHRRVLSAGGGALPVALVGNKADVESPELVAARWRERASELPPQLRARLLALMWCARQPPYQVGAGVALIIAAHLVRASLPDTPGRQVHPRHVRYHLEHRIPYWDVSVKETRNLEPPFLYLARALTGDATLEFFTPHMILPPIQLSPERIARYQQELDAALLEAQQLDMENDDEFF